MMNGSRVPRELLRLALAATSSLSCDPHIDLGSFDPASEVDATLSDRPTPSCGEVGADCASRGQAGPLETGAGVAAEDGMIVDGDGRAGIVLWSADFETDDLSQWNADREGGIYQESALQTASIIASPTHGGGHAAKITITPPSNTMPCVNYIYRQAPTPPGVYYGVWVFLPHSYVVPEYLNLIHFAGSTTNDDSALVSIWDVDIQSQADGSLSAYLFRFPVSNFTQGLRYDQSVPIPMPIGQWVHFEVFFHRATTPIGAIAVWQDGVLIFDVAQVATAPTDFVRWNVGGASATISPSPADVFIDDAAITTARLGP